MKFSILFFLVIISAIAGTKTASAQQQNLFLTPVENHQIGVTESTIQDTNQAANLATEAATIDSKWQNVIIQPTNSLLPTNNRISIIQQQGCQKMNPLEFLENPGAAFEKCQELNNNQTPPPRSSEPIEYLKVPKLDSGISVTVTQF
ncbi:hypothetical protein H6G33_35570 [Calothrix sp. FACHB-1219]|uniref:hypothetical protein n=1 Tax=unclassified Calothrix TaxID=2619626 RepID=UPI000B5F6D0C|nr:MULTISPECIES: hypothetical protein [unclassified Calothrix]MBD2207678.1 hypothetical protein [Calothrix sp. FACHB-168]MBD2222253.1 hypothetical protein [Calothrix sp. FACHB-1219]BAY62059.1 hypothetical protein NIES22_21260 [Calothrix brevissima NIES-22]